MKYLKFILAIVIGINFIACNFSKNDQFKTEDFDSLKIKSQRSNQLSGKTKIDFIKDSLADVKENNHNIELVEITKFTDTLSIRYLTNDKKVVSNLYQKPNSDSKHISTTYISSTYNKGYVNEELLSVIALLESKIIYSETNSNETLESLNYLIKDFTEKCNVLYLENYNSVTTTNIYENYNFDKLEGFDESIYFVNHLLKNYQSSKFIQLWENDFLGFKEIYKKQFSEVKKQVYNELAYNKNQTNTKEWEDFVNKTL